MKIFFSGRYSVGVSKRRLFAWILFFLLFLLNVLGHHEVSKLYKYIILTWGKQKVDKLFAWGSIAGLWGVTLWIVIASIRRSDGTSVVVRNLGMWFLSLFLCVISFRYLICYMVEIVHFPQYAIFGLWGVMLIRDSSRAIWMVALMGIIDETINYIVQPRFTPYLDFNDMVLNFCGAMLGVSLYHGITGKPLLVNNLRLYKFAYCGLFILIAFFTIGVMVGIIELTSSMEKLPDGVFQGGHLVISFRSFEDFWEHTKDSWRYHVMTPVEGILSLGVLFSGLEFIREFSSNR